MNTPSSSASAVTPPVCHALVPCAGVGARAGADGPKQYRPLLGLPMVLHTLSALREVSRIAQTLVVLAPEDRFLSVDDERLRLAHCGGDSRARSVYNGLRALSDAGASDHDWVLVHDAARCLITAADIDRLIDRCLPDAVGGLLAIPLADTLKQSGDGRSQRTLERSDKWLAQTPQMFRLGMLRDALATHEANGFDGITDEASAMELAGHSPLLVEGGAHNFKVTYPQDFLVAEAILGSRPSLPGDDREVSQA